MLKKIQEINDKSTHIATSSKRHKVSSGFKIQLFILHKFLGYLFPKGRYRNNENFEKKTSKNTTRKMSTLQVNYKQQHLTW